MRIIAICFFAALISATLHAAAAEFITTPSGLQYAITHAGDGPKPQPGQVAICHYVGTLADDTVFDSSYKRNTPFTFTLGRGQVIKGMEEAFQHLRVGDKATLIIPPTLAYGDKQRGPLPPNSTLRFDIEVLDVKERGLSDALEDRINSDGLEAAAKWFAELKAAKFAGYYVGEALINDVGYRYLRKQKVPQALAMFRWNVELFPDSANAYDSLAESERKAGNRELAIQHYTKSLQLDPTNENAEKMLAELNTQTPP